MAENNDLSRMAMNVRSNDMGSLPGRVSGDAKAMMMFEANKRSMLISYVLWFFLGGFGAHRFYNGRNGGGVAQLLLTIFGLLLLLVMGLGLILLIPVWIWVLVDAFLIPGWVRNYNNGLAHTLGG
jgi:TM2 domain-containing membrane protein YozV